MICKDFLLILILILFLQNCDHGLEPPKENDPALIHGAISGTITYQNWPPADSLKDLRLIVFKQYPPTNIFLAVTSGQAIVFPPIGTSEGLPINVDLFIYNMDIPAGTYEYVVVAQQFGDNVTSDWRAVGQYDTTGTGLDSIPTLINISSNQLLENINIKVDFNHIPYQPFVE